MPWFLPWSETIKKSVTLNLIQRYLGQYLEHKLSVDQLSLDLYNGTGSLTNVSLDTEAVNILIKKYNIPFEVIDGSLEEIFISVPWSRILSDNTSIVVKGLSISIQPSARKENVSMFGSMVTSMTTSLQLAEECLRYSEPDERKKTGIEGLERFAQTIELVLAKIKIKLVDTKIRVEHVSKQSQSGVAVEIRIDNIDYYDEAGLQKDAEEHIGIIDSSIFTIKRFKFEGVKIYTDEFPSVSRTFSRSMFSSDSNLPEEEDTLVDVSKLKETFQQQHTGMNLSLEPDPILFGVLSGVQELKLTLKSIHNMTGSVVDIEVDLGYFLVFFSPSQVYVLMDILKGFQDPLLEDRSNIRAKGKPQDKPMRKCDFEKIETMLLQQKSEKGPKTMQYSRGWSCPQEDSSVTFLPMGGPMLKSSSDDNPVKITEDFSEVDIGMENSVYHRFSSGVGSETAQESPLSSQITVQLNLAACAAILLHENVLTPAPEQFGILAKSSVLQMKKLAEDFFEAAGTEFLFEFEKDNYRIAHKILDGLSSKNHLRIFVGGVNLSHKCVESEDCTSLTSVLHLDSVLVAEGLVKTEMTCRSTDITELLRVSDESTPCLRVTHTSVEYQNHNMARKCIPPKSELQIWLNSCDVEVDVTLVDRISSLMRPIFEPHVTRPNSVSEALDKTGYHPDLPHSSDVQISFVKLKVHLRFPVLDLRPIHDMDRLPWWVKSLHKEVLVLQVTKGELTCSLSSTSLKTEVKVQFDELTTSFIMSPDEPEVFLGKISRGNQESELHPCVIVSWMLERPKTMFPTLDHPSPSDPMTTSMYGSMFNMTIPKYPSPFGSKKIVYSNVSPGVNPVEESGEELLTPGTREEMSNFIDSVLDNSLYHIQLHLPSLELILPSKQIFEVLYNRLTVDLLLWEPMSFQTFPVDVKYSSNQKLDNFPSTLYEAFTMCRSAAKYDSENSDSDNEESSKFYSLYECPKVLSTSKKSLSSLIPNRLAVSADFSDVFITILTPFRDNLDKIIPGYHGKLTVLGNNGSLFFVSGYQGKPNDGYILLWCELLSADHQAQVASSEYFEGTPGYSSRSPLLYSTPDKIKQLWRSRSSCQDNWDAVSMAVHYCLGEDTNSKIFKVALTCRDCTLLHAMYHPNQSWVEQLIDFMGVVDYPVAGYLAPRVITEFYLHLHSCAVQYKPVNLPYSCAVLMDDLSLCSNIISQTNASIIRFIVEEAALFLSPSCDNPKRENFVCVVSVGLFDLSLRLTENPLTRVKSMELNASNNALHIWTCSDTCKALAELLAYYASFGDLSPCDNNSSKTSPGSPVLEAREEVASPAVSQSQVEMVHDLMIEAMKESSIGIQSGREGRKSSRGKGVRADEFLFPDESKGHTAGKKASGLPLKNPHSRSSHREVQPGREMSLDEKLSEALEESFSNGTASSSNTDDDFYVLEDDLGSGIKPRSGEPEVRVLTDRPINIIDNFYPIPAGQVDILKTPRNFPFPMCKYILREINLVWHMYDGHDFEEPESKKRGDKGKRVHISSVPQAASRVNNPSGTSRPSKSSLKVSFTAKDAKQLDHEGSSFVNLPLDFESTSPPTFVSRAFHLRGGPGRVGDACMEVCLNKLRFLHEVYPETTLQAARFVFIINNFEIRDRLVSSQFNKFLHQYSSPSLPRQSHANMLTVKALLTRPDPALATQECSLKISLLPLKLNIDQDALFFFYRFFMRFICDSFDEDVDDNVAARQSDLTPPVMGLNSGQEPVQEAADCSWAQDNPQPMLMVLEAAEESSFKHWDKEQVSDPPTEEDKAETPIYFRSVVFSPDAHIVLDYHGKHIHMEHGRLAGLLMGLGQLKHSKLKLKRVVHRHGLLGYKKVTQHLLREWIEDIRENQVRGFLEGVGPMCAIVQIFQGVRDLFWLPVEQYKKDGRIVKGIQRGAHSFTTSTALAALEITNRIVQTIQSAAETAYDMISPGPSIKVRKYYSHRRKTRSSQPADVREGVANAVVLVREGVTQTAQTFVTVANREHEQKGVFGAVGCVLRQIPPAVVVKPIILASEATSNVLDGIRNQFAPETKTEEEEKWKSERTS